MNTVYRANGFRLIVMKPWQQLAETGAGSKHGWRLSNRHQSARFNFAQLVEKTWANLAFVAEIVVVVVVAAAVGVVVVAID